MRTEGCGLVGTRKSSKDGEKYIFRPFHNLGEVNNFYSI